LTHVLSFPLAGWLGDQGVIDMALLSVIRRWHFREGMPIREIKRRTGLSRNTIRKYLRAGVVDPKFKVPDRPSKLDPFAEKLSGWLRVEAGRSRKQRRTVKQMHADLVALGYDGSYGRVAAFERAWTAERQRDSQISGRGTFVPLVFAPGEAFQFDWSEDWAMLGGEHTTKSVRCLRDLGRVIVYGSATGEKSELDPRLLYAKGASVHGLWLTYLSAKHVLINQAWKQLSTWTSQGHLHPVIGHVFPMEHAAEAYQLLSDGKNFGKMILKIG